LAFASSYCFIVIIIKASIFIVSCRYYRLLRFLLFLVVILNKLLFLLSIFVIMVCLFLLSVVFISRNFFYSLLLLCARIESTSRAIFEKSNKINKLT